MKKILIISLVLGILILSGCNMRSQNEIISECLILNVTSDNPCIQEECMVKSLVGFTGLTSARTNYFQCLYIHKVIEDMECLDTKGEPTDK